tara:strand:+ start:1520 stop:2305 length:786 start_codon:yes stop_codon:yes gene_type:complete
MKALSFKRTYFIIDCDANDKIIKVTSKQDNQSLCMSWIGRDIFQVAIKEKDTDQNVNFYHLSDIDNKIFNIDLFETSEDKIIYLAKEIDSNEGLYFKANYDALSRLPNRNLLNDRFNLLLSQSKRTNSQIAILFIDLDGFKKINDNYGHNVGDLLLIEISNRLKKSVRDSDTISRWGGDEFIILLNNVDGIESVDVFVNRIIKDCSKPVEIDDDLSVSVSLSVGISMYPANGDDKNELLELADKAMYIAKKNDSINHYYSN